MTPPLPTMPCVVVEDICLGWQVYVQVDRDTKIHEDIFEVRSYAQSYGQGLAWGVGCPLEDRSTDDPQDVRDAHPNLLPIWRKP